MTSIENLMALTAEHQQDEAYAVKFMRETDVGALKIVWDLIQDISGGPFADVICRCAQLGFTHALLLAYKDAKDAPK